MKKKMCKKKGCKKKSHKRKHKLKGAHRKNGNWKSQALSIAGRAAESACNAHSGCRAGLGLAKHAYGLYKKYRS